MTGLFSWGVSSGAISVALQMVALDGNSDGLFRGAFMESGSPIPVGDFPRGQNYYDLLADYTNCAASRDTLQCLREVPYQAMKDAIAQTTSIWSYEVCDNLTWRRTDRE
jgi:hypothetical protein